MHNSSDLVVETLIAWGVDTIFGLPGDGINGIMEALRNARSIRFIQVRHEEAAAFMACAYAKCTGRLGVCLATSVPAAIHCSTGSTMRSSMGARARHHRTCLTTISSTPLRSRTWISTRCSSTVAFTTTRIMGPAHVENVVVTGVPDGDRAARRGAHLLPVDCRRSRSRETPPSATSGAHVSIRCAERAACPRRRRSERGRRRFSMRAERSQSWPGRERSAPREELKQRRIFSPRRSSRRCWARRRCPTTVPHHRRHRPARHQAFPGGIEECDTLLMVGTTFPYIELLPEAGTGARGADRRRPGAHRPALSRRSRAGR